MEPAYAFSIPSIEDDTPLDCRIYHPTKLHALLTNSQTPIKGAVVAHPYPPLGGCYDDPVVLSVTETLLEQGYIVGTFNFRCAIATFTSRCRFALILHSGAGGSEGRTSWSGKAEQGDYSSVAGFMAFYLHALKPVEESDRLQTIPSAGNQLDQSAHTTKLSGNRVELLLAGYSYGSLVLARLQPISAVIKCLESAEMGTAGAELILRARTLAKQTRLSLEELYSPSSPRGRQLRPDDAATSPTKRIGASRIVIGGEETDPANRRRSRDSRRSVDFMRKSVEMPHRIKAQIKRSGTSSPKGKDHDTPLTPAIPANPMTAGLENRPVVSSRYLVISPVLLPFTQTLCPPGPPSLGLRRMTGADASAGALFLEDPTMVIFGSTDGFTAARRLKGWAEKMAKDTSSQFEWHEIDGAGHFWREAGVMQDLQEKVAAWVKAH